MGSFGLVLLLLVRTCASARQKLSYNKQGLLDLGQEAIAPDEVISGSGCGGDFLTQLTSVSHDSESFVTFDYQQIADSIREYIKMRKRQIDEMNEEEVTTNMEQFEHSSESTMEASESQVTTMLNHEPTPADKAKNRELLAATCNEEFKNPNFKHSQETDGIEICKAVKCGLKSAPGQPRYDLQTFYDKLIAKVDDAVQAGVDGSGFISMHQECIELLHVPSSSEETYDTKSSWCKDLCNKIQPASAAYRKLVHKEMGIKVKESVMREEVTRKFAFLKELRQELAQCEQLLGEMEPFVAEMKIFKETHQSTIKERQTARLRKRFLEKKTTALTKLLTTRTEELGIAESNLENSGAKVEQLVELVNEKKMLEVKLRGELSEYMGMVEAADSDIEKLTLAQAAIIEFKAKLSTAFTQMNLLYKETILTPLGSLVWNKNVLQTEFPDPQYLLGSTKEKLINEIATGLNGLKDNCAATWMVSFEKFKLVKGLHVLPSELPSDNMTRRRDEQFPQLRGIEYPAVSDNEFPDSDIEFPDDFLKDPGNPSGLPDLCSNLVVQHGTDEAVRDILLTVGARRMAIIESFLKIQAASQDIVDTTGRAESIIAEDTDDHECEKEPEGLRKFGKLYGKTKFYQNYAALWANLKEQGEFSYFLRLEAQVSYLLKTSSEWSIRLTTKKDALDVEIKEVQKKNTELITALQQAKNQHILNSESRNAVELLLKNSQKEYNDMQQQLDALQKQIQDFTNTLEANKEAAHVKHNAKTGQSMMEAVLSEMKTNTNTDVDDSSDPELWRRRALELRAEIEKIKREAIFLPPF